MAIATASTKLTTVGHLINGKNVHRDGGTIDIFNPAKGEVSKNLEIASSDR